MQKSGESANAERAIVELSADRRGEKQSDNSASTGWTFNTLFFASDRWVIEATRINGPCFLLCGTYSSPSAAAKSYSRNRPAFGGPEAVPPFADRAKSNVTVVAFKPIS